MPLLLVLPQLLRPVTRYAHREWRLARSELSFVAVAGAILGTVVFAAEHRVGRQLKVDEWVALWWFFYYIICLPSA